MKEILIATKNRGKFFEINEILNGLPYKFLSLADIKIEADVEEDGADFTENALKKADFFHSLAGMPVIAEDSGLIVDALPGELGVKTRRWGAGAKASDEEWIEFFMDKMKDVDDHERTARFICVSVFRDGDLLKTFAGKTEGVITRDLEAPIKQGLPLSSCFKPLGCEKVYSALSFTEKSKASHRGKALRALRDFISSL